MRGTLIFIITILSISVFGQQLQFKEQFVDTILIRSNRSSYQFDDNGTTIGESDIISIAFNQEDEQYFIDKFYRENYQFTIGPEALSINRKNHKSEVGKFIDSSKIRDLLVSLSTNMSIQDLYYQVDTLKLKKNLTDKQIRRVARWYEIDWYFKKRYSTKEQTNKFFEDCKSIDTLKIYLKERMDTSGYAIITDYSSTINIWIKTNKSEYRYEGKYPNPVRQPWYNHDDTSRFIVKRVLNLQINQALINLLPKDFLLKETISIEALVNDYITWYFKRRKMRY